MGGGVQQYAAMCLGLAYITLRCHRDVNRSTQLQCCALPSIITTTRECIQPTADLSLSFRFNSHFPGGPVLAGTRMSPFWILLELTRRNQNALTKAPLTDYI